MKKFTGLCVAAAIISAVFFSGCAKKEEKKVVREKKEAISYSIDLKKNELQFGNVKLELVEISAGSFDMGSPAGESARDNEKLHKVTLTRNYWIGKFEVTQEQWKAVMGENPSCFKGNDRSWKEKEKFCPVECVSWNDAQKFCEKLNKEYAGKLPRGYKFDLPTEAQWEYACRAGLKTAFNNGVALDKDRKAGWYKDGAVEGDNPTASMTHKVGEKAPNKWGLYDMHGNVWEWCRDSYEKNYAADPEFLIGNKGEQKVARGGCWGSLMENSRSAFRHKASPGRRSSDFGFRLALVPVEAAK